MPTINEEIARLNKAKQDIKKSIEDKGVIVGDGTIDTYSAKIDEISTGIEPTGTIEITQNGTYDVTTYASANVNTPSATLGTKDITENGTYNATDDNLDGYSQVSVNVAGAGVDEYFRSTYDSSLYYTVSQYMNKYLLAKQPPTTFTIPKNSVSNHSLSSFCQNYQLQYMPKIICDNDITSMSYMFSGCEFLKQLNVSGLNTNNVTNMSRMFYECGGLTNLDVSNFNTSQVTNMERMFGGCSKLTSIDLSNLDTSKVTTMNRMFANDYGLKNLDFSNNDVSKVTDVAYMFYNCGALTNLDLSSFELTQITQKNYYEYMFSGTMTDCYILVKDQANKEWITSKFTNLTNVHYVGE